MREFVINENDASQRVDKYIQKTCHQMPKSLMFRLIRQKKIKVNGKIFHQITEEELLNIKKESSKNYLVNITKKHILKL